jgi:hypothetical protein
LTLVFVFFPQEGQRCRRAINHSLNAPSFAVTAILSISSFWQDENEIVEPFVETIEGDTIAASIKLKVH